MSLSQSNPTEFLSAGDISTEPRQRQGKVGPGALRLDIRPDLGHNREAAREVLCHPIRLPQSCEK